MAASPTPDTGVVHVVTRADDGRSMLVSTGDRLVLWLDPTGSYSWSVSTGNPAVLAPVQGTPPGSQGMFLAVGEGTATLTAQGQAVCQGSGTPCTQGPILIRVQFLVQQPVPAINSAVASPTAAINPVAAPTGPPSPGPTTVETPTPIGPLAPVGTVAPTPGGP